MEHHKTQRKIHSQGSETKTTRYLLLSGNRTQRKPAKSLREGLCHGLRGWTGWFLHFSPMKLLQQHVTIANGHQNNKKNAESQCKLPWHCFCWWVPHTWPIRTCHQFSPFYFPPGAQPQTFAATRPRFVCAAEQLWSVSASYCEQLSLGRIQAQLWYQAAKPPEERGRWWWKISRAGQGREAVALSRSALQDWEIFGNMLTHRIVVLQGLLAALITLTSRRFMDLSSQALSEGCGVSCYPYSAGAPGDAFCGGEI